MLFTTWILVLCVNTVNDLVLFDSYSHNLIITLNNIEEYIVNAINKKHIDKEDNLDNLINREHPLKLKNNNEKL